MGSRGRDESEEGRELDAPGRRAETRTVLGFFRAHDL